MYPVGFDGRLPAESVYCKTFLKNTPGKTHGRKLTVDEDDTFVNAVGGNKAPLYGEIISAEITYRDF